MRSPQLVTTSPTRRRFVFRPAQEPEAVEFLWASQFPGQARAASYGPTRRGERGLGEQGHRLAGLHVETSAP